MFDFWELLLFGVAALIAVRTLLGLMQKRRDRIVTQVQNQVDAHQAEMRRQAKLEAKKKKRQEAA